MPSIQILTMTACYCNNNTPAWLEHSGCLFK